jgi:hypothetical protein
VSSRTLLLAGLCSAIVMASAPGCDEGTTTGTQAKTAEAHSKRNKEMGDFMKNEAKKGGAPAKTEGPPSK